MTIELVQMKKKRTGSSISSSSSDEDVSTAVPLKKLAPGKLYNVLEHMKLSCEQLQQNGYPFWDPSAKQAVIPLTVNNQRDFVSGNDLFRKCARCRKGFSLNADGTMAPERCVYHHRPKWDPVQRRPLLTCCNQPGPSSGCIEEERHVFNTAWEDTLWEFMVTPSARGETDFRSKKVYGLDCELIHTLNGLEVARVSLVNMKGKVVLDTFVLPTYEVISYNSTFSGVTERDMENAISLKACRLQLFQYINSETLLVGHSLESDLKALRLVHHNVIDTSVLFSIRKPDVTIKLSLQTLAKEKLGKTIQNAKCGHSSIEDSITCLELLELRPFVTVN